MARKRGSVRLSNGGGGGGGNMYDAPVLRQNTVSRGALLKSEILRRLLGSYFGIVRKTIQDQVPKAVTLLLVEPCVGSDLSAALVSQLLGGDDEIDALVAESPELEKRRAQCVETLRLMEDVVRSMADIRVQASKV